MSEPYEIRCDAEGCGWRILFFQAITETQARELVRVLGGSVQSGGIRDYHHCPRHSMGKLP